MHDMETDVSLSRVPETRASQDEAPKQILLR